MKRFVISTLLVLFTCFPAIAATMVIDCIPNARNSNETLCSQVDKDGNWILVMPKDEHLASIELDPRAQQKFLKLYTRAAALSEETLKQGKKLQGFPVGEITKFKGYQGGMVTLALLLELYEKDNGIQEILYRLVINHSGRDAHINSVFLDQKGLDRLFQSGEKAEDLAIAMRKIEETLYSTLN